MVIARFFDTRECWQQVLQGNEPDKRSTFLQCFLLLLHGCNNRLVPGYSRGCMAKAILHLDEAMKL
jgi:hypothetical protein